MVTHRDYFYDLFGFDSNQVIKKAIFHTDYRLRFLKLQNNSSGKYRYLKIYLQNVKKNVRLVIKNVISQMIRSYKICQKSCRN